MAGDGRANGQSQYDLPVIGPRPKPGGVRLQLARWVIWFFFGTILLVTPFAMVLDLRTLHMLLAEGITTTATVTGKHTTGIKSTSYYLQYSFRDLASVERASEDSVSKEEYDATAVGVHKEITYARNHPDVQRFGRVDAERVQSADVLDGFAIVMVFLICGGVIFFLERYFRSSRRPI